MIPQRLQPGGESVCTSYIPPVYDTSKVTAWWRKCCTSYIPPVYDTSKVIAWWRKCLYLLHSASLWYLKGYSLVEKVSVPLTFRQSMIPQRLQPSGESVCNNNKEDFASLWYLKGYTRVVKVFYAQSTSTVMAGRGMPGIYGVTSHGRCWRKDARNLWRNQSWQILEEGCQESVA